MVLACKTQWLLLSYCKITIAVTIVISFKRTMVATFVLSTYGSYILHYFLLGEIKAKCLATSTIKSPFLSIVTGNEYIKQKKSESTQLFLRNTSKNHDKQKLTKIYIYIYIYLCTNL